MGRGGQGPAAGDGEGAELTPDDSGSVVPAPRPGAAVTDGASAGADLAEPLERIHHEVSLIREIVVRRSGPLPDPQTLADYNAALPGLAERIVRMAEREQGHRHQIERSDVHQAFRLAQGGQRSGIVALAVMALLAGYVAHLGHPGWAAGIAGLNIAAVVGAFVTGQMRTGDDDAWADQQPDEPHGGVEGTAVGREAGGALPAEAADRGERGDGGAGRDDR